MFVLLPVPAHQVVELKSRDNSEGLKRLLPLVLCVKTKKKVLCRGILCDCIVALGISMSCNVASRSSESLGLPCCITVCNSHTALGRQWAQSKFSLQIHSALKSFVCQETEI